MAGWTSNVCPHCGATVDHGNYSGHERACIAKPSTRAAVLQALTDPDDPARGVSGKRYDARRTLFGAPYSKTLLSKLGTWGAVCAEMGLLEPLPYNQKCKTTPPEPCPHCGKSIDYHNRTKHDRTCVHNPAVHDAILSCLRDPQYPDHALSAERYNARRVMLDAPSDRTVAMQYDGSWETVYAAFGLKKPLVRNVKAQTIVCEYCEREFQTNTYDRHSIVCPRNPANYDAIHAAMQDAEYPEYAIARGDYHERAKAAGLAGVELLRQTFGGWTAAVEYFGFNSADGDELQQQQAMEKILATARLEARLLREDAEQACRFTALRVRDLPGVTVNGKPCVAIMLR